MSGRPGKPLALRVDLAEARLEAAVSWASVKVEEATVVEVTVKVAMEVAATVEASAAVEVVGCRGQSRLRRAGSVQCRCRRA